MKNLNFIWTKEMYQLLSLLILEEVFGSSTEWSKEEAKNIKLYIKELEEKLSQIQINFIKARLRKMKYSYKEDLLYSLEKMNWHELHEDYGTPYVSVEYDQKTYDVWTQAVRQKKSIKMTYDSTTSGLNERLVDPYKTKTPYGEGYCHLKKDVRKFRFDRVIDIKLTNKSFIKK